jgi:hypothetical protein
MSIRSTKKRLSPAKQNLDQLTLSPLKFLTQVTGELETVRLASKTFAK